MAQCAGIVEDAIDARIHCPAGTCINLKRAGEHEIAADIDQIIQRSARNIGLTEAEALCRTAGEGEISVDVERSRCHSKTTRIDCAAAGHRNVAADGAGAAQRAARIDGGEPCRHRLITVDIEAAGRDCG